MGLYVYDGHGLWTLNVLHGFENGLPIRGVYFKKTSEANQSKPTTEVTGSQLLKLENAEQITRARLNDPLTRQDVLDKLHDSAYRGSLIFAAANDSTTDFGQLYSRCVAAKDEWDATNKEVVGGPLHGEMEPGPHVLNPQPEPGQEFDPADTDQDGIITKPERKAWNKKHPEDPR